MSLASCGVFRGCVGVALVEHHLLAVVCPAFNVGVGADDFANVRGELVLPEELHVMAGIGLVHACGNDGADVERGHVLLRFCGIPLRVGQRDIEVCLGGVRLERPRRVHRGLRGGSLEWRRLFERRLHIAGDGDDVVRADESDLGVEAIMEGLQQMVRRGVHACKFGELLLGRPLPDRFPWLRARTRPGSYAGPYTRWRAADRVVCRPFH